MTEWKPIPGYPGYRASDDGQIKGSSGIILKGSLGSAKYRRVTVYVNTRPKYREIHSLILLAFHGPNPGGMECRHLNGDSTDNRAANLAWGTRSENIKDQVFHGTHPWSSKTECNRGHKYDKIRESDGARLCSKCAEEYNVRRKEAYRKRKVVSK